MAIDTPSIEAAARAPGEIRARLYTRHDLAQIFGVHWQTIGVWEKHGRIPHPVHISRKVTRWTADQVAAMLATRQD